MEKGFRRIYSGAETFKNVLERFLAFFEGTFLVPVPFSVFLFVLRGGAELVYT